MHSPEAALATVRRLAILGAISLAPIPATAQDPPAAPPTLRVQTVPTTEHVFVLVRVNNNPVGVSNRQVFVVDDKRHLPRNGGWNLDMTIVNVGSTVAVQHERTYHFRVATGLLRLAGGGQMWVRRDRWSDCLPSRVNATTTYSRNPGDELESVRQLMNIQDIVEKCRAKPTSYTAVVEAECRIYLHLRDRRGVTWLVPNGTLPETYDPRACKDYRRDSA